MATAEAKRPRLRITARPMRVWIVTCNLNTMGIGMSAKSKSVAMLMDELKTPTFLKIPAS
jgi:hypothetical protein